MKCKEHKRTLRYLLLLLRSLKGSKAGDAVAGEILDKYEPKHERES